MNIKAYPSVCLSIYSDHFVRQGEGGKPRGALGLWLLPGGTCSGEGTGTMGGEFDWGNNVKVKKSNEAVNGGSNYDSLKVAKGLVI